MTSPPERRWLPRFGLRSLFVVVLVVAAYFGSWSYLHEIAKQDVSMAARRWTERAIWSNDAKHAAPGRSSARTIESADSIALPAPYILSVEETALGGPIARRKSWRRYYLWLFGWTVRLPITTDV